MPAAGIDIGASSVKTVVFNKHFGDCTVRSFSENELAEGVVVDGGIEKPDALVEVLRSIRLRERVRFAHASLPERKAYLYQIFIPNEARGDLRAAVEFSLESNVPIQPKDVYFDYEVVRTVSNGVVVSVSVYAKRVVDDYYNVFHQAGIELRSFEIESQAVGRSILNEEDKTHTTIVVDFGRKTTRIAIYDHGVVGFAATIDVGGEKLTSAVMKHFSVSSEEAETIKNEKGFLQSESNRDLYEALMTTVSVLKDEISRHIVYWDTQNSEENIPHDPVDRMILIGGNANLKGLSEYLSRALNLPSRTGDVWQHAFSLDTYIPGMPRHRSLEYVTTVGLALRSCNPTSW